MATKKKINEHLKKALREIGSLKPWFDKKVNEWIFKHPLYPVNMVENREKMSLKTTQNI